MTVAYYISENKSDMRGITAGTRLRMTATSLIDAELAWVPRARRPRLRLTCGNLRVLGERELDREERAPRGMSVPSTSPPLVLLQIS
jgi:hypothetical protein